MLKLIHVTVFVVVPLNYRYKGISNIEIQLRNDVKFVETFVADNTGI